MSYSLQPHGLNSSWNSPGQNTGVGSLSLLQGNIPGPGIKLRSPILQANSLQAEPQGKPLMYARFQLIVTYLWQFLSFNK